MDFVRIKEDVIRLDMITRIREGRNDETFYGRSVRKGTEAWIEIHFVGGEVLKLESEAAIAFQRFLQQECRIKDISVLGSEPHPAAAPRKSHA